MLDYQTLDTIADAYNPILLLATLAIALRFIKNSGNKSAAAIREAALIVMGLVWIYGWMLLDLKWRLWPALGMDYSTHTAFAGIFVFYLSLRSKGGWQLFWPASLILYCLLMLYQRYHTLADIVSTALFTAAGFGLMVYLTGLFKSGSKNPS